MAHKPKKLKRANPPRAKNVVPAPDPNALPFPLRQMDAVSRGTCLYCRGASSSYLCPNCGASRTVTHGA